MVRYSLYLAPGPGYFLVRTVINNSVKTVEFFVVEILWLTAK